MTTPQLFWPSDYSGMIMHHLRCHPELARAARVCDIGTGSGILAATALQLGARDVVATDLDADALDLAAQGLAKIAPTAQFEVRAGNLWDALEPEARFDLVLANLPNFPADALAAAGRPAAWSVGGASGRRAIDPFLAGLAQRLGPGGVAIFTQNRCIGLGESLRQLHQAGLTAEVATSALVPIGPEKIAALSPECREPSGIVEVAGFVFLSVDLIVARRDAPSPDPAHPAQSAAHSQSGAFR
jgi:release factor glutamine methyltransferase